MNIDFRDVTIFVLVWALLWALTHRTMPAPKADARPVPETDSKVVQGQFGGSERKVAS